MTVMSIFAVLIEVGVTLGIVWLRKESERKSRLREVIGGKGNEQKGLGDRSTWFGNISCNCW